MSIKIRKGNKTNHFLLHSLEWFNIMVIGVSQTIQQYEKKEE